MSSSLVPIIAIGMLLIGALFALISPKGSSRFNRGQTVFVIGAVILVSNWLIRNPSALAEIETQLAMALIGLVFVFIRALKR